MLDFSWVRSVPFAHLLECWEDLRATGRAKGQEDQVLAALGRADRYFLLTVLCRRTDLVHPWHWERCREVEAAPDGFLDLWARGHGKSSIITQGGVLQELLRDPEITIGIFSNVRPLAKAFLSQIMTELEGNEALRRIYSDVLWANPRKEARGGWSLDEGIVVKRRSNPPERTVEAWGLIDSQPTGKHFKLRVLDDVVTQDSVTTPEMMQKTLERWELAQNLASLGMVGADPPRVWHVGTRYHYADAYSVMIERGAVTVRLYPATENGEKEGRPVLLTDEAWAAKLKSESDYTIACQQLLDPVAGELQEFKPEWRRYYELRPSCFNVLIMGDPAGSKKKGSDKTAIPVVAVDPQGNRYLVDGFCHRMNLSERWIALRNLHKKWSRAPGVQVVAVGWEKYGMQADIEYFLEMMQEENYYFDVTELAWPREGPGSKIDRVRRMVPDFANSKFWLPTKETKLTAKQTDAVRRGQKYLVAKQIKQIDENRRVYNLLDVLEYELARFPAVHVDLLDAISRLYDMDVRVPVLYGEEELEPEETAAY